MVGGSGDGAVPSRTGCCGTQGLVSTQRQQNLLVDWMGWVGEKGELKEDSRDVSLSNWKESVTIF